MSTARLDNHIGGFICVAPISPGPSKHHVMQKIREGTPLLALVSVLFLLWVIFLARIDQMLGTFRMRIRCEFPGSLPLTPRANCVDVSSVACRTRWPSEESSA